MSGLMRPSGRAENQLREIIMEPGFSPMRKDHA